MDVQDSVAIYLFYQPYDLHCQTENRISKPVLLEISLDVVSRPGVLFSDRNATRSGSIQSSSPKIVRFDIVKAESHMHVEPRLRHFYQAEPCRRLCHLI